MSATVVVLHRAHRISRPPTWRPYMKQDLVIPGSQIMVSVTCRKPRMAVGLS